MASSLPWQGFVAIWEDTGLESRHLAPRWKCPAATNIPVCHNFCSDKHGRTPTRRHSDGKWRSGWLCTSSCSYLRIIERGGLGTRASALQPFSRREGHVRSSVDQKNRFRWISGNMPRTAFSHRGTVEPSCVTCWSRRLGHADLVTQT